MAFEKLTGKTAYIISLFRKLILQVEESYYDSDPHDSQTRLRWRDATLRDVLELQRTGTTGEVHDVRT